MTRDFCSHCGTTPGKGEKKCETPEQMKACPWMVGVHRGVIVMPPEQPKKS